MIHAEILDLLSLIAQRSVAAPLPQASALAPRAPGEHFSASVESALPEGGFAVRVGGRQFAMQLPPGVNAGDRLDLVLLSGGARPVFGLQGAAVAETVLSSTARLVDGLLQQAPAKPAASAQALIATPADSTALAQALEKTIEESGLFYESHQAQWLRGERSLEALRAEPQAQLAPARAADPPREPGLAQHARASDPPRSETTTAPQPERAAQTAEAPALRRADDAAAETASERVAPDSPPRATLAPPDRPLADPQALPLLRQQIETLESRQILWQGEIWPRQQAQWTIGEEAPEHSDREAPPRWRSRLQLELPALGALHASLTLGAAGIGMRIAAADPHSAAALRTHLPRLAEALAARAIPVRALEIVHAAAP